MPPVIIPENVALDADSRVWFTRQLEYVMAKVYERKYPEYSAKRLFPVTSEAGKGAESIVYHIYDGVGVMKIISNYADDLPTTDVYGEEKVVIIRDIGGSYSYSLKDVEAGAMANRSLPIMKANMARQVYEQTVNQIAWTARPGDGKWAGLYGVLYHPNITKMTAHTSATSKVKWSEKTPDEIIKDLNDLCNKSFDLTNGVEIPDTLALAADEYAIVAQTKLSQYDNTTILEFFRKAHPEITMVERVHELNDVQPLPSTPDTASSVGSCAIAYKKDPDKLRIEIPWQFEQLPVQAQNLAFKVPTYARLAGAIVMFPLSVTIMEGIG
jgi:hypothetical protein